VTVVDPISSGCPICLVGTDAAYGLVVSSLVTSSPFCLTSSQAGGYVGSVLSEMLTLAGYDVICLDRFYFGEDILSPISGKVRIVKDDIRTFDPSLLNGVDAVLDLASLSNDPSQVS
jgi:hypothetical protein